MRGFCLAKWINLLQKFRPRRQFFNPRKKKHGALAFGADCWDSFDGFHSIEWTHSIEWSSSGPMEPLLCFLLATCHSIEWSVFYASFDRMTCTCAVFVVSLPRSVLPASPMALDLDVGPKK
ncbi:hypothetical protein CASFOL_029088 [Castilleja foliolosa]|uniref:Uncharacterized protein n=1 Tax=Castilleja foliolosa TaxID=1961234 RepID=A0ABD3CCX1_9LAMI